MRPNGARFLPVGDAAPPAYLNTTYLAAPSASLVSDPTKRPNTGAKVRHRLPLGCKLGGYTDKTGT